MSISKTRFTALSYVNCHVDANLTYLACQTAFDDCAFVLQVHKAAFDDEIESEALGYSKTGFNSQEICMFVNVYLVVLEASKVFMVDHPKVVSMIRSSDLYRMKTARVLRVRY